MRSVDVARSYRLGLLLLACAVLVGLATCRLDVWLLPQRWSLSDEPLPAWFYSPLGQAWNYGAPLVTFALLGASVALLTRGAR